MPRRQRKSNRPRRRNGRNRYSSPLSDNSCLTFVTRIRVRNVPFAIEQASSGNGGLTTMDSQVSLTANNRVPIDPFTIGGRAFLTASDFQMYKFEHLRFTYVPMVSRSGVTSNVAGPIAGSTATVAERLFSWGCGIDPAQTINSFLLMVSNGSKIVRTCDRAVLDFRGGDLNQWRWNSGTITSASTTPIDQRMVAPLIMSVFFPDTSTTATQRYGLILCDAIIAFKGCAANVTPISLENPVTEEKSLSSQISDDSPIVVSSSFIDTLSSISSKNFKPTKIKITNNK